jgi:hypothetical protein
MKEFKILQKKRGEEKAINISTSTAVTNLISTSNTSDTKMKGEITHTMNAMLDRYVLLDDDSKNALLHHAIPLNSKTLLSPLFILEEYISSELLPTEYMGDFNPLADDFWLLVHNHPLGEHDRSFTVIVYPENDSKPVITEGVIPALEGCFHLPVTGPTQCMAHFCAFLLAHQLGQLFTCNQ